MNRPPLVDSTVACRVSIRGIVQGVGFRPFVFRAAASHGVVGWVLNGHAGVEVHAEGSALALRAFLDSAPPPDAARIAQFDVCTAEPLGLETFEIRRESLSSSHDAHIARSGDLRRLPAGNERTGRSTPPLSLHQLYELWAAIFDYPTTSLRPSPYEPGRLAAAPDCLRTRLQKIPTRPTLSCSGDRLPGFAARRTTW